MAGDAATCRLRRRRAGGAVPRHADGQPIETGEPARGCLFVTLHEEGGTLKVIGMQRVPERLGDQGWPP